MEAPKKVAYVLSLPSFIDHLAIVSAFAVPVMSETWLPFTVRIPLFFCLMLRAGSLEQLSWTAWASSCTTCGLAPSENMAWLSENMVLRSEDMAWLSENKVLRSEDMA